MLRESRSYGTSRHIGRHIKLFSWDGVNLDGLASRLGAPPVLLEHRC